MTQGELAQKALALKQAAPPRHGGPPIETGGGDLGYDAPTKDQATGAPLPARGPPLALDRATYTIEQAARVLGISRNLAYACARAGEIPTIKLGGRLVVPKLALERMLEALPVEPQAPARRRLAGGRR
jgi:excisionase family DNA binding protein